MSFPFALAEEPGFCAVCEEEELNAGRDTFFAVPSKAIMKMIRLDDPDDEEEITKEGAD